MDKIEAQTWFSCSIYCSRSEVLSEILGNVKNTEFVKAKQQMQIFSCLNTKLSCFLRLNWVLVQKLTSGMKVLNAGWEFDPTCLTHTRQSAVAGLERDCFPLCWREHRPGCCKRPYLVLRQCRCQPQALQQWGCWGAVWYSWRPPGWVGMPWASGTC